MEHDAHDEERLVGIGLAKSWHDVDGRVSHALAELHASGAGSSDRARTLRALRHRVETLAAHPDVRAAGKHPVPLVRGGPVASFLAEKGRLHALVEPGVTTNDGE